MANEQDKFIDELRRNAERQGWRYSQAGTGHHQFYGPDRHTIVTFAKSPSDWRGNLNSLAKMKQAGYVEPNGGPLKQSLGEALDAATQPPPTAPEPPTQSTHRSVPALIEECLDRKPDRVVGIDEIRLYVKGKRPGTGDAAIAQEASRICKEGRIKRMDMGMYASKNYKPLRDPPPPAPPPAPPAAPPPTEAAPANPMEDTLAADIQALEDSLNALAAIEGVVRRTKARIDHLIQLRKMLGGG